MHFNLVTAVIRGLCHCRHRSRVAKGSIVDNVNLLFQGCSAELAGPSTRVFLHSPSGCVGVFLHELEVLRMVSAQLIDIDDQRALTLLAALDRVAHFRFARPRLTAEHEQGGLFDGLDMIKLLWNDLFLKDLVVLW